MPSIFRQALNAANNIAFAPRRAATRVVHDAVLRRAEQIASASPEYERLYRFGEVDPTSMPREDYVDEISKLNHDALARAQISMAQAKDEYKIAGIMAGGLTHPASIGGTAATVGGLYLLSRSGPEKEGFVDAGLSPEQSAILIDELNTVSANMPEIQKARAIEAEKAAGALPNNPPRNTTAQLADPNMKPQERNREVLVYLPGDPNTPVYVEKAYKDNRRRPNLERQLWY